MKTSILDLPAQAVIDKLTSLIPVKDNSITVSQFGYSVKADYPYMGRLHRALSEVACYHVKSDSWGTDINIESIEL